MIWNIFNKIFKSLDILIFKTQIFTEVLFIYLKPMKSQLIMTKKKFQLNIMIFKGEKLMVQIFQKIFLCNY